MTPIILTGFLLLLSITTLGQQFSPAFDGQEGRFIPLLVQGAESGTFYFSDGISVFRSDKLGAYTRLPGLPTPVHALAVNQREGLLGVATPGGVYLYDLAEQRIQDSLVSSAVTNQVIRKICFSAGGSLLAVASGDYRIQLFDLPSKQRLHSYNGHTDEITSLLFSPGDSLLISGSGDETIRLWHVAGGATAKVLTGHRDWVRDVAVSPDSLYLASAGDEGRIYIWRLADSAQSGYIFRSARQNNKYWISAIRYTKDGKLLSLDHKNRITIWYPQTNGFGMVARGSYPLFRSVERQPIAFALGKKHDFYVATLGHGILADPYFQLLLRRAHPLHITAFNGITRSPKGFYSYSRIAHLSLDIGRLDEVKAIIVENITNHTADTLTGSFENIQLVLPQKRTMFRLHLIDEDSKVPVEFHHIDVYRAMEYPRWLDRLFVRAKFIGY